MARGGGKALGCLATLLALVVVAALAAWGLGLVDRALYLMRLEQQAAELTAEPKAAVSSLASTQQMAPASYYVYAQLNEADREKYRIVLDAVVSREERAWPNDDMQDLTRIRDCVFADHPELFYTNGIAMRASTNSGSGLVTGVTVYAEYVYDEAQTAVIQQQVEAAARECLAGLPAGADDYAKAKYLYEYLADTISYERVAENLEAGTGASPDQTVEGALVYRRAVCSGYASAYQYLMQELGISCTYVMGQAKGEAHAWCLVQLDGAYYYVDPTWGDPQFAGEDGEVTDREGLVNYDYLCITTSDLERGHLLDVPFGVPSCTATADNYYVREGLLFTWADERRVGELADAALDAGNTLQIRCADDDVYNALYRFVADGTLSPYLSVSRYWYSRSDAMRSIMISAP